MLSSHLPELSALQVLLAVAQTGSLNAAAAELGVSQQAVSARISSIEAQVGVALLTRTPRGSSLTPQGVVVAAWAARLLEVAGEVDAGIASLRAGKKARLRVSASLTIAEQLLPGWLVALSAEAASRGQSSAEVVLTATNSAEVAAQVRAGQVDLGFVEGPTAPRGLRSRSVGRDRLLIVVSPEHPWARRQRPLSAAELARTPLVTREAGSGTRGALEAALRLALGAEAKIAAPALALSTTAAVRAAVLAGGAPAVVSELAVGEDLAAGRLRSVATSGLDLARTLRAVWVGGSTPPAGLARDLLAVVVTRSNYRR
ncbi:MAG: putative LysR-family transcriptional regulator [Frankiales bacterium]|nr:putative LysR-family transcriptional regulator [Frankiales bacterium]